MITLAETERVIAAWAERCSGPGWSNRLIHVLIRHDGGGAMRIVYVQPHEQTPTMLTLFNISAGVAEDMRLAAEAMAREGEQP